METNPATEVTENPEAQLEAIFSKQLGETQEVEEVEESPEVEAEETESEEAEEGQSDETEETEETEEETTEGFVEIELEGEKFQVPEKLKDAFLRQQDYTKKTQEVAERRRQVEEQEQFLQQRAQLSDAALQKAVEVRALASQLEQYSQINWEELADQDPAQALKLNLAYQRLQQQHTHAAGEFQQIQVYEGQMLTAKRQEVLAKASEELAREIKGFGTQAFASQLKDTGKSYGFSEHELSTIVDPRHIKVLHDAHQWRELQKGKAQINKKVATVKPVKVSTGRAGPINQQAAHIQDAKARLKKSGKSADAEAYLERLFSKRK